MRPNLAGYRKLRILLIVYDTHVPPDKIRGIDLEKVEWRSEYEVASTLNRMGQNVKVLGVGDDLAPIWKAVEDFKPHVAINLLEEFHSEYLYDQNVVSYLELLQLPYVGCNPRGLVLSRDKALTKKLLSYHQIPVPQFAVFPKNRNLARPTSLAFPLIVKALNAQASIGISQSSVVFDDEKLKERVDFIHSSIGMDAIAETYIEGRELYVGVLGNNRIEAFPVWELRFNKRSESTHQIATHAAKWDPKYIKRMGIKFAEAKLSKSQTEHIQTICKHAYRILGLSGYARMDLRLSPMGEVYLIEANPNPHIGRGEALAESARRAGVSYEDLLWRILTLGMAWQPGQLQVA